MRKVFTLTILLVFIVAGGSVYLLRKAHRSPTVHSLTTAVPTATQNDQQVGSCVYELKYVTKDGRKFKTTLEPSDCNCCDCPEIKSTHDPRWLTTASGERQQWLGYKAADGRSHWTKVYANARRSDWIDFWYEHRGPCDNPPNGNPKNCAKNDNEADEKRVAFYSWDGNVYEANLSAYYHAKKNPCFKVDKIR